MQNKHNKEKESAYTRIYQKGSYFSNLGLILSRSGLLKSPMTEKKQIVVLKEFLGSLLTYPYTLLGISHV
jgi:hypothetical protein